MQQELQKISQLDFIKQLEEKKQVVDKNRPLSKDLESRIFQKLKLDWNFNSNAIEGNSFTYGETVALLMEGITAKGKPLKDALDIKGHNDAIQFMLDMIKGERDLNENDIRSLHKLILGTQYENPSINADGEVVGKKVSIGTYKTMPNHVLTTTGETHYYATPEETPAKMTELVAWFNEQAKKESVNPVVLASLFHHRFVAIHPFDDGNGRMTRILTNFILMKFGYPISVIKNEEKKNYYSALAQADTGQILPFIELMATSISHSLDIYIKGINGEDINDPDDLDKEIELFRKEIGFRTKIKVTKKEADLEKIIFEIFTSVRYKLRKFIDMFESYSEKIYLDPSQMIMSLKGNEFKNFDEFKMEIDLFDVKKNNIEYIFVLNNHYLNHKISMLYNYSIIFKKFYYEVSINGKKRLKYYDEIILDKDLNIFLNNNLRKIMSEIKDKLK